MKLRFSKHALDRLSSRSINGEKVKDAILNGQQRNFQEHGTIKCLHRKGNRSLVVIYQQIKDEYIVVTAYYL